ncbi:hypothetical protein [Streptomyces sp. NPDC013171]|uniref:hypothetical protein n=1 Tax=Streptomyces sp. NPDC013171 TaxID=3364863 RepID=UPI0036B6D731
MVTVGLIDGFVKAATGHADWGRSVATAVIDGHLVTVTGVDDKAVLVWNLTGYRYQRQVAPRPGATSKGR